jgi:hypothetical protein
VAILFGFAPWIVYWVLVGDVPLLVAALTALATAVAAVAVGRYQNAPGRLLEFGSVATFVVVTILTVALSESALQQWSLALSFAGLLATTLLGVASGEPFVREFAAVGQPPHVVEAASFLRTTAVLTWIWVGAFAGMTVSAVIPAIAGAGGALAYTCYWVIPMVLLAAAVFATRIQPERLAEAASDVRRKTTFVAYSEAAIDELYYLAGEHVNKEVGAGEEAYDVKVGGSGLPLVGDESRQSWPATYKVRRRRR